MFVGLDSHFTQSSPGAGLDQKAATLHAQDVTALSASWTSDIDTVSTDTVNLSSDLSGVIGGTTSTKLTSSLAKILQSATSVDPATGSREINTSVGQALGTQLGQLLTQSGFSKVDADAASQSLLNQLSSTSQSSSPIAVSITSSAKTAGSYTGALSGGQENSTWSAQSTTALSIFYDASSGNLSVKLDQHQISATSITWGQQPWATSPLRSHRQSCSHSVTRRLVQRRTRSDRQSKRARQRLTELGHQPAVSQHPMSKGRRRIRAAKVARSLRVWMIC